MGRREGGRATRSNSLIVYKIQLSVTLILQHDLNLFLISLLNGHPLAILVQKVGLKARAKSYLLHKQIPDNLSHSP